MPYCLNPDRLRILPTVNGHVDGAVATVVGEALRPFSSLIAGLARAYPIIISDEAFRLHFSGIASVLFEWTGNTPTWPPPEQRAVEQQAIAEVGRGFVQNEPAPTNPSYWREDQEQRAAEVLNTAFHTEIDRTLGVALPVDQGRVTRRSRPLPRPDWAEAEEPARPRARPTFTSGAHSNAGDIEPEDL